MNSDIIIVNPKRLKETQKKIRKDGVEKLQIISDFDRTINYGLTGEGKIMEEHNYQKAEGDRYILQDNN